MRKKLKQPSFAAGVNRDDVYKGAEELGVDLDEHIAFVIAAMRPIASELGLRTHGGRRVTARFDALGVVVADIPRACVLPPARARVPRGRRVGGARRGVAAGRAALHARHGGRDPLLRPRVAPPERKQHRPRVRVRLGRRRRRGLRGAHRRRLREPQGAVGRVLGPCATPRCARPRWQHPRRLRRLFRAALAGAARAHAPIRRSRSSSLVHQPHDARTSPVPGISRTITPFSASRATVASGSSSGGTRRGSRGPAR